MPTIRVNGINFHYNCYGSGAPFIFVHGLGCDQMMWNLQIPVFSRDYQVIVYDVRGHGRSESPDHPYSIDLFADDLHQFLQYLGLKKSYLAGLSMGGRILFRFALKYPEEASALIIADAQSETPEEGKNSFRALAEIVKREGIEKSAEFYFSLPVFKGLAEMNPKRFREEKERFSKTSMIGLYHSCLAVAHMEPMTDRLSEIKVPTLALAGEKDDPYLPFLDIYARQIPNCQTLIIPKSGHFSNLENPEAFNGAVRSFMKRLEKG
jgi:3-oxoadipate enol-lactonase